MQCPLEAISWSRRKFLILEEILTYRPHVLCLQEVDHYYDTLQPVLSSLGYGSSFCPKPWSPCLAVEGNNGPDGCALFYDQTRFQLLDGASVQLSAMRIPTNQVRVRFFVGPFGKKASIQVTFCVFLLKGGLEPSTKTLSQSLSGLLFISITYTYLFLMLLLQL